MENINTKTRDFVAGYYTTLTSEESDYNKYTIAIHLTSNNVWQNLQ